MKGLRCFPPGAGEVEVEDNNRRVEGRGTQAMEGRDTEIKSRVSGRRLRAWCCSDSLTFPEWPIVPGFPPFEKFKSAQIQGGVRMKTLPPSVCRRPPPPCPDFNPD